MHKSFLLAGLHWCFILFASDCILKWIKSASFKQQNHQLHLILIQRTLWHLTLCLSLTHSHRCVLRAWTQVIVYKKSQFTAFSCVLGYLVSLPLISFTLIFLARNLFDRVNEAKFLAMKMLVTFYLVAHSTKREFMEALKSFWVLGSNAGKLHFAVAKLFGWKRYELSAWVQRKGTLQ